MKRSTRAAVRDASRRAQRLQLIRHDVPQIDVPAAAAADVPSSTPTPTQQGVKDLDAKISAAIDAQVEALVRDQVQAHVHALRTEAERVAQSSATQPSSTQPSAANPSSTAAEASPVEEHTAPYATDAESSQPTAASKTSASEAAAPSAKTTGPAVRVVTRSTISGDAARQDAPPSLARKATPERAQSGLAARCLAHAGQHYRGATEEDVIDAWNAMRERFHLSPDNKIVARRALLKWLQRSKNVCASNVHWYGNFVAIRSCGVRVKNTHPAAGADGWFVLFDPNGEGFMREPLFSEAFETPKTRYAAAVPRLGRPAWISEERRAAAAARHGGMDVRPFSPETADDLSAADFFRGKAE